MAAPLLLDTHTLAWTDAGLRLRQAARGLIEEAAAGGTLFVSPVSAWEIGMLVAKGRLVLDQEPSAWFDRFASLPGVRLAPLTPAAAVAASFLPGMFHGDPADRLLVATARERGLAIVTRDRRILEYSAQGWVGGVAC